MTTSLLRTNASINLAMVPYHHHSAEFSGRRYLDHHCHHQRHHESDWVRSAGAVLRHEHLPIRCQLPGLPTPGICFAAFYPLRAGKGGRRLRHGDYDRYLFRLRRHRANSHGERRQYGLRQRLRPPGDRRRHRGRGFSRQHPLVAGIPAGQPVHHSHVLYSDPDRVSSTLQINPAASGRRKSVSPLTSWMKSNFRKSTDLSP